MVEYVALMMGALGLMFFLFFLATSLKGPEIFENEIIFSVMDVIKLSLLLFSFLFGVIVCWLMALIGAENGASAGLQNALTTIMLIWSWLSFIVIMVMCVYWFWWIPKASSRAMKERKRRDEDDAFG